MTGNIALDVFIGLAFIYMLYSLYTTVIVEIIASIFRLRSKNLQHAIKRMLTDDEKSAIRDWIQGIVKIKLPKRWSKTDNQTFLDKFFNQPTIKYLSKSGFIWERKPSYLAPHSFSKAILDTLKNEGTGETLIDKVISGIDNCTIDENTRKHIKSLLEDANNDLQKFKLLLEQWFNDTMERSIGWFKRNNQLILFIIGLIIAVTFNVNTIHIAKLLSKDNKAREQMVALAISDAEKYSDHIKILKDTQGTTDSTTEYSQNHLDSLYDIENELKNDIKKTEILFGGGWNLPENVMLVKKIVLCIDTLGIKKMKCDTNCISINTIDTTITRKIIQKYKLDEEIFWKSLTLKKIKKTDAFNSEDIKMDTLFLKCICSDCIEKDGIVFKTTTIHVFKPWKYKITYTWNNKWGYLLTALAISLGSPFWFDLLNKLVKLRGSTRQAVTSESSSKSSGSNENSSNNSLKRVG